MLLVVPIRTESVSHRYPLVNHILIGLNLLSFLVFSGPYAAELDALQRRYLDFHSHAPQLHQFVTYQFLHAGAAHLLGNLVFLWVFGNSVNGKLGNVPYLLFYLAGGIFAAWGFAVFHPNLSHLVGASGAIAAVTTAYLALFPRSHVTVLVWVVVFIQFVEVPAMILIGLKIIVWDNVVGPRFAGAQGVAHTAHLAGYFFGFAGALLMLWVRALPRDQFDILALWKRWHQRRVFASVMADPAARAQAQWGKVARVERVDPKQLAEEERRLDEVQELREKIASALGRRDINAAAEFFERLVTITPRQCLSEREQFSLGRELYVASRHALAARAFEQFLENYPNATEAGDVRLLLGIIYARDLKRPAEADQHLTRALRTLRDAPRKEQCLKWLGEVRASLGLPPPELAESMNEPGGK